MNHNIIRPIKIIIASTLIIFFAVKIYNLSCATSGKCSPFYFSYLSYIKEGKKEINVELGITSYYEGLVFEIKNPEIKTFTNKKNTIKYSITNNSSKTISFKSHLLIEPIELAKYIDKFECLCFKEVTIKPKKSIEKEVVFFINKNIEEDQIFYDLFENKKRVIKMRYMLNDLN